MNQPQKKKIKVLFATNNPGKITDAKVFTRDSNIELLIPKELGLKLEVDESGESYEANALLKAEAFQVALNDPEIIVIADDGGIEIPSLGNEPGVHTRRWKGYSMPDQELIDYCLQRMYGKKNAEREAHFVSIICMLVPGKSARYFKATLKGSLTEEPSQTVIEGFPFKSLMYIPSFGAMSSDVHGTTIEQRGGVLTHREKALQAAFDWLHAQM